MINKIKMALSIIVIVFGILGISQAVDFNITNPIMLFALATLLVIRSYEYKKQNDKSSFILTLITAVFVYIVIFYNVFIG